MAKVGDAIDAINKNTLTLSAVERTADTIEFTWDTQNPTKYPVYVHIGIPPVIGSDGVIYGRYESPHLADTPITPGKGTAEWKTSVAVPADVTGLYVLPSVESKQQKNFSSHAIDITGQMSGSQALGGGGVGVAARARRLRPRTTCRSERFAGRSRRGPRPPRPVRTRGQPGSIWR